MGKLEVLQAAASDWKAARERYLQEIAETGEQPSFGIIESGLNSLGRAAIAVFDLPPGPTDEEIQAAFSAWEKFMSPEARKSGALA